jgi:hypothetical protein
MHKQSHGLSGLSELYKNIQAEFNKCNGVSMAEDSELALMLARLIFGFIACQLDLMDNLSSEYFRAAGWIRDEGILVLIVPFFSPMMV